MFTCSTARSPPRSARCAACWRTTRPPTACGAPGGRDSWPCAAAAQGRSLACPLPPAGALTWLTSPPPANRPPLARPASRLRSRACRVPEPLRPFMLGIDFIPFRKAYDAKGKLVDRPQPAAASADGAAAAMSTS